MIGGSIAVIAVLCIAILGLIGLLVHQQLFWSKQAKDLIDRLMARSIGEFERAKNPPPPRVVMPPDIPTENFDRIF